VYANILGYRERIGEKDGGGDQTQGDHLRCIFIHIYIYFYIYIYIYIYMMLMMMMMMMMFTYTEFIHNTN
jgi:hypothetical protein